MTSTRGTNPTIARIAGALAAAALAIPLAACSGMPRTGPMPATPSSVASSSEASSSSAPSSGTASPTATAEAPAPADPVAGWSLEAQVGQLVMIGVDVGAPSSSTAKTVRDLQLGGVFLAGRTRAGQQPTANLVRSIAVDANTQPDGIPMLVATDQEGGQVQVLRGPGFSELPTAIDQSQLSAADLRGRAATWGAELASAGVNMNLAPVADVIPSAADRAGNPPIGAFKRNYGYGEESTAQHASAFAAGMRDAGVIPTLKHFPGLGLVTANTDVSAGVTDTATGADAPSVRAFGTALGSGEPAVMMSSAVYERLDASQPAVFSSAIVRDLLRGTVGFDGLVITDDLSAAKQVAAWSPGERAVRAVGAGNDVVLASASPEVAPEMVQALIDRGRSDPQFADVIAQAARRVVSAKAGL